MTISILEVGILEEAPLLNTGGPPLNMVIVVARRISACSRDEYELPFAGILDPIAASAAGGPINVINSDVLTNARRGR